MSHVRRNALTEKIALWEERNQRIAAQTAAAQRRSIQAKHVTLSEMVLVPRSRPVVGSTIGKTIASFSPRDGPTDDANNNKKSQFRKEEDEETRKERERLEHIERQQEQERLQREEEEEKARVDEEVKKELARMEKEREDLKQQQDQERLRKEAEREQERARKREEEARERERLERLEAERKQKEEEQRKLLRKEEEEKQKRLALEQEQSEKELELERFRQEEERLHQERLQREEKARLWRIKEENKAATKIQARWRAWHEKRKFQAIRKMNHYRTQVAQEILSTEETYVKTLRDVVEHFVRPLKEMASSGKPIITHDEIKTIFSHIQIILGYNDALLEDLRKKISNWYPYQKVGDVFLRMAAFMRVYTDYVRNFNDALAMIQECKKSPDFVAFCLETYPKMSVVQADLSSYLITPVQRIPRYQLLVRDLLKHTWKEHSDYDNLEQALQQITTTAIYVNDKQKEAENIQKMLSIQASLYGKKLVNLVDPQRRFIREGCLVEINVKGKGKPRWFFLFTDLLVKCNMSNTMKKKTFKKGAATSFEYVGQLCLEGCELVNSGDEGDKKHGFQVNTSSANLWLCAASEDEKVEWIRDVKECIKLLKEKSDLYDEHATKIASQRAAAAKALIAEQYTGFRVRGSYAPPSGAKRAEYRKGSLGGNNPMDLPDESETDLGKSSFRALSAQERFHLAKQAEQRLSQLLEEEKQQTEAGNERVKHFKDSMGKRYSSTSTHASSEIPLMDSGEFDLISQDGSESGELRDSTGSVDTLPRTSSSGSLDEAEGILPDGVHGQPQPGKRRFASMKREHYRGQSAAASSKSATSSPKEEREESSPPLLVRSLNDAPAPASSGGAAATAAPRTRKFASLKREDYRSARASRYTASAPPTPASSGSAELPVSAPEDVSSDREESDVVIHEDAAPTPLAVVLERDRRKTNYATGRQRYPSVHTRDLAKGGSGGSTDFGDVAELLSQLKTTRPPGESKLAATRSAKASPPMDSSGEEASVSEEQPVPLSTAGSGATAVALAHASKGSDKKGKKIKKKFSSLRPADKKSSAEAGQSGSDGSADEPAAGGRKYSSMKRDDFKAQSAAFGAIELKDMLAAARPPEPAAHNGTPPAAAPAAAGPPKRRFASMKRENYKSFKAPTEGEAGIDDHADD